MGIPSWMVWRRGLELELKRNRLDVNLSEALPISQIIAMGRSSSTSSSQIRFGRVNLFQHAHLFTCQNTVCYMQPVTSAADFTPIQSGDLKSTRPGPPSPLPPESRSPAGRWPSITPRSSAAGYLLVCSTGEVPALTAAASRCDTSPSPGQRCPAPRRAGSQSESSSSPVARDGHSGGFQRAQSPSVTSGSVYSLR